MFPNPNPVHISWWKKIHRSTSIIQDAILLLLNSYVCHSFPCSQNCSQVGHNRVILDAIRMNALNNLMPYSISPTRWLCASGAL